MKKVTLLFALIIGLGFHASASATSSNLKAKSYENFSKVKHPGHPGHYRVGDFYRRVPRGAARVNINGRLYFKSRGVWFKPVRRGFVVVHPPRYRRSNNRYGRGSGNDRYGRGRSCGTRW